VRRGPGTNAYAGLRYVDLSDTYAAIAVGCSRTSNLRCRPHCSRSGPSVPTPATSGIKATADIAGGASASIRSLAGQSSASAADWRRSKPNVCCPSTRAVATDPNQPDEMKVSSAGSRRWRRSVRTAARRPRQAESTPQGRCAPCLRRMTRWHLYAGRMTPHFAARAARFVAAGLHASEIQGRPARPSTKPTISPSTTVPSGSTTACAARRRR
jgi:hypothetical protein